MKKNIDSIWRKFFKGKMHIALHGHILEGLETFIEYAHQRNWMVEGPGEIPEIQKALSSKGDLSKLRKIFVMHIDWDIGLQEDKSKFSILQFKNKFRYSNSTDFDIKENNGDREIIMINELEKFFKAAFIVIESRGLDAHIKTEYNNISHALSLAANVIGLFENSLFGEDENESKLLKSNALQLIQAAYNVESIPDDFDEKEMVLSEKESIIENNQSEQMAEKLSVSPDADKEDDTEEKRKSKLSNFKNSISLRRKKVAHQVISNNIDYGRMESFIDELLKEKLKSTEFTFIEHINSSLESSTEEVIESVDGISRELITNLNSLKQYFGDVKSELPLERDHEEPFIETEDDGIEIYFEEHQKQVNEVSYLTEAQAKSEFKNLFYEIKEEFRCRPWENIAQGPIIKVILSLNINSIEKWKKNFGDIYVELGGHPLTSRYIECKSKMDEQLESKLGDKYIDILGRINFNSVN